MAVVRDSSSSNAPGAEPVGSRKTYLTPAERQRLPGSAGTDARGGADHRRLGGALRHQRSGVRPQPRGGRAPGATPAARRLGARAQGRPGVRRPASHVAGRRGPQRPAATPGRHRGASLPGRGLPRHRSAPDTVPRRRGHPARLRPQRHHHRGDGVRGAARECGAGEGPGGSGPWPRGHPGQRQPPRVRADDHRPSAGSSWSRSTPTSGTPQSPRPSRRRSTRWHGPPGGAPTR